MRLTYIANIRLPTEKAHGIQIMKMCEAFASAGYRVELLVPARRNHISEDPFSYYGVKPIFSVKRVWCLDTVRFGRAGFLIESLSFSKMAALRCFFRGGYFYTRDEMVAFYLRSIGKRVTWEVHMGQRNFFARLVLRLRTPLVTITQGLKDLYLGFGVPEGRILVAHDAVDPATFRDVPARELARVKLGLPADGLVVGYIGKYKTLGASKGVENIIGPFRDLARARPEAFLLIVGPEPEEARELEVLLKRKGINPRAYKIVSHVPHRAAPLYMRACDLLLMLYPNTTRYARFMSPLKLFEYMASGTAILASDLPSLREVLDDSSAYFFDPDDGDSLGRVLIAAATEKSEREQKAKMALEASAKYTWNNRAQTIIRFMQ